MNEPRVNIPEWSVSELAAALKKAGLPTMANGLNSQALFNYDYTFYTLESNFDPDGSKARLAE